ncbi:MAG: hypothetical protein QG655_4, partial [Actinomycetota bacterium]|nr:hypothetical protein [Actinomycetota bacterium]
PLLPDLLVCPTRYVAAVLESLAVLEALR